MANIVIKCPNCGETDLIKISETAYQCGVCGAMQRDERIEEILELLKNNPEDFVGNIRFRLRTELGKDPVNLARIEELADKILDHDPTDPTANFFLAFAGRNVNKKAYKTCICELAAEELQPFQVKQIAGCLIRFYDPTLLNETELFLKGQNVYVEYGDLLSEKAGSAKASLDRKDPTLRRDVLVVCDEADYARAEKLVEYVEGLGLSCWFAPRNFDENAEREKFLTQVAENCTTALLLLSHAAEEDKELREFAYVIAQKQPKDGLRRRAVYALDDTPTPTAAFFENAERVEASGADPLKRLADTLVTMVESVKNKDRVLSDRKLDEAVRSLEVGNYGKAIRSIEDMLESGGDEKELRKLLLRAHAEDGLHESREATLNYERLKTLCAGEELAALENAYPVFIDEKEAYAAGMELYRQRKFDEAIPHFERAAKKCAPEANNKLGEIYFMGKGVARNVEEGMRRYEEAAKAGCADAQRVLGVIYLLGNNVAKDENKAFRYFLAGAQSGNAFCQLRVADCYSNGTGTGANPAKAFEWYKKAAEQGLAEAIRDLGYCYKYGKGAEKNAEYALKCFETAALKGDLQAKRERDGY